MKKKCRISFKFNSIQIFQIVLGTYLMSFGFYFFFEAAGLVTGGVGGIAILLKEKFSALKNTSYVIMGLNVILLIIGRFFLGRDFFYKTVLASILYPLIIFALEGATRNNSGVLIKNMSLTSKYILAATVGSLLTGVGLGFVFNANATTGGMDIIQKIITKYLKVPLSISIYSTDGIVVLSGFFVYNAEKVLYAILSIVLIGYVVDKFTVLGNKGYTAFIITEAVDDMKTEIIHRVDRGFTKISVKGGYTNEGKTMIVCTVRKREVYQLKEIVKKVDPKSFSFFLETTEVVGNRFERKE